MVRRALNYYRHKNPQISELLDESFFEADVVSESPQDYVNDIILSLGVSYVINKRKLGSENAFFVVEGGAPHLPAMACVLRQFDIEPYFYLTGLINESKKEYFMNYAYFGPRFERLKEGKRVARLFDTHSSVDRKAHVPEIEKLNELGIDEIYFVIEGDIRELDAEYNTEKEFSELFSGRRKSLLEAYNYYSEDFEAHIYEADPRASRESFDKAVNMLKGSESLQDFLVKIWGYKGKLENPKDIFRILRLFRKLYF